MTGSVVDKSADRLHLGCGLDTPSGWLNVDGSWQATFARWPMLKTALVRLRIYPRAQAAIPWSSNVVRLNLNRPLPFGENQFSAIYSSHTFEHLYRDRAAELATECYRVLQTNGVCRVVVPDLRAAVKRYIERAKQKGSRPLAADSFMGELMVQPSNRERGLLGLYHRWMNLHQHKWMYDGESLAALLCSAGFQEPKIYHSKVGNLPGLEEIEHPSRIENGAGVAVEVTKL